MDPIIILDGAGEELARETRVRVKRFSLQAARDHKAMDRLASAHPAARRATIGRLQFEFRDGRSTYIQWEE